MFKAIATTIAVSAALVSGPLPTAHAVGWRPYPCDAAAKPPAVQRQERKIDRLVTTKVWVTHTSSLCNFSTDAWVVSNVHVHEWKRYGRDVPGGFACQMWARDLRGVHATKWTRWHLVPWGSATNC